MNRFKRLFLLAFALLSFSIFTASDLYGLTPQAAPVGYDNPQWAPPYFPGVRYYYLPDIETYYDLESQNFVFLYNGQWCYSQECPSVSAGFDLNTCFAIALDINVYQPWMHHHYYISHYPRYYYQDYYDHSNIPYVRGFNENSRSAIFWRENERHHARRWDREALKINHKFKYSDFDRKQQNTWNRNEDQQPVNDDSFRRQQDRNNNPATTYPDGRDNSNRQQQNNGNQNTAPTGNQGSNGGGRNQSTNPSTPVRMTQGTNYYGKTIGQPVKVERQMRQRPDNNSNDNRR
jgi:hypothetical protein